MLDIDFSRIAGALVLVGIASVISRWQTADLEKQMLVATARAFVQLIAIGYALHFVLYLIAYPAPIPGCDAQYNHLLERRTALSDALARLDAAREDGAATPEDFCASTPLLAEG